ncbi:MAG: TonB family protein [Deltaproteobacteria bacterium]|nr:TonB family protein [Deltaproteobacteria bacterium]
MRPRSTRSLVPSTKGWTVAIALFAAVAHAQPPEAERAPRDVMAAVERAGPALQSCYERTIDPAPPIRGRSVVLLTIEPDGRVSQARTLHSSIARPDVDRCLVAQLRRIRYPARARAITVRIPFDFRGPREP